MLNVTKSEKVIWNGMFLWQIYTQYTLNEYVFCTLLNEDKKRRWGKKSFIIIIMTQRTIVAHFFSFLDMPKDRLHFCQLNNKLMCFAWSSAKNVYMYDVRSCVLCACVLFLQVFLRLATCTKFVLHEIHLLYLLYQHQTITFHTIKYSECSLSLSHSLHFLWKCDWV